MLQNGWIDRSLRDTGSAPHSSAFFTPNKNSPSSSIVTFHSGGSLQACTELPSELRLHLKIPAFSDMTGSSTSRTSSTGLADVIGSNIRSRLVIRIIISGGASFAVTLMIPA